jgi:hypothetical protein
MKNDPGKLIACYSFGPNEAHKSTFKEIYVSYFFYVCICSVILYSINIQLTMYTIWFRCHNQSDTT